MKIDGVQMRPSDRLAWRYGDPSRDKNLKGEPIGPDKKVVVRKKDCNTYMENGQEKIDPTTAPAIPQRHVDRRKAFGCWRKQERENSTQWIDGEECEIYWTAPYYVVMGNTVYQGPVYSKENPFEKAREKAEKIGAQKGHDSHLTEETDAGDSVHFMEL